MGRLTLASLLFALSFGLIARHLSGVDPSFVAAVRLGLAALLFLPFLRPRRTGAALAVRLAALGAVQYGAMYLLYIRAYRHLAGHEVALFTALTPLHVVLIEGALARRVEGRALAGAALAVAGAALIEARGATGGGSPWAGFVLVQAANLCFAAGQVLYRRLDRARGLAHRAVFAWLYLGGAATAGLALVAVDVAGAAAAVDGGGWLTLVYLGLVPSGLAFFLWNVGATRVRPGTLAAFNNLKVPLAVLAALALFGERADPARLAGGALLIASGLALTLAGRPREGTS